MTVNMSTGNGTVYIMTVDLHGGYNVHIYNQQRLHDGRLLLEVLVTEHAAVNL